ncbi:MAG: FecR domain-containing protein [Dysgonamonadaceae bacterium]|jgi:ferric-dicitrate binding protein FerR (iron transport regulator)|nr:FecR domain-containing protein [Dysgonamonadaceae bacterium]
MDTKEIDLLLVKLFSGIADTDEIDAVKTYVASAPENRAYFQEMKNLWETTHPAFDPESIDVAKAYNKVAAKANLSTRREKRAWYIPLKKYAAAAAIAIPLTVMSVFYINHRAPKPVETAEVNYQKVMSPNNARSEIELSDGTKVALNVGSSLEYPRSFSGTHRTVNLEGEAYFQVKKDSSKPFIVHTKQMDIEVLGTKFNVNAYPDLSEIRTTLEEGKVKVTIFDNDKTHARFLTPNEEISLNLGTGDIVKKQVNAQDASGWLTGKIVFTSTPLSDVLTLIGRRYNVPIDFQLTEMEKKRLTVRFDEQESVENIFKALESIVPDLVITKHDNKYHVNSQP